MLQKFEKKVYFNILHEEFGMKNFCEWWVPHLFNATKKRKGISQQCWAV